MSIYDNYFLKNNSFFTYNYIISKLDKYNKNVIEKYNDILPPLYQGKIDFNDNLISKILNEDFLDNNKLHCISMMIEYMLYWTSKNVSISDSNKRYDFLSYFMNNANHIFPNMIHKQVKSVHGYVIFSDFIKVKNKIVIKTPKEKHEIRNMLFEYYIGSRFINKLRNKTPNFMYTYGIFMCNPLINVTKKNDKEETTSMSVNFCNDNDKNNIYLLFEKIDGIGLHDYILQIKTEKQLDNIVNYILQIIISLDIAQKEGQYSHNDLHNDNIMIRKINSPIDYSYIVGKSKYKMKLDNIATIIDYGMNRFVENNIPLGVTISEKYDLYPFKNSIGTDLYKFTMSNVISLVYMIHKNPDIYKNLSNKIDEVFEFLISFFRDILKNDITTSWDEYIMDKNKNTFNKFKQIVFKQQDTYYYPMTDNFIYYNQATPENFIEHIKNNMQFIWNKHIIESEIDKKEIIISYSKIFNPQFDQDDYDDYMFSKCFNSIYFYDYIKQNNIFYELFNKKFENKFSKDCLNDEESMIINFNNIKDCKNIISLFYKDSQSNKDINIINEFEKQNIKDIKINYKNDINTLLYYIKQMDNIILTIDTNLFNLYKNPKFVKVSMEFFNENMKKQIEKMHNYLKIFEKYILLTTYSLDLKDVSKQYLSDIDFNFDLFEPRMKYFDIALNLSNCINKYYKIIYQFYFIRVTEETNKDITDVFTLSNLIVLLQNNNPHFSDLFENFLNSFINTRVKSHKIHPVHYVPVNSYNQIKTYLSAGNFYNQMQSLTALISRFVEFDFPTLKNILSMSFNSSSLSSKNSIGNENNINDLTIYNKLKENRKTKDISKKDKRNIKRANEIFKYISDGLKYYNKIITGDQYYHLDYGGNDGSVASEFAKITKLDKSQIFSADVESWLGNKKNNLFNNITYTMLSENQKLPYSDESFDSVSLLQVLHHIEFLDVHLREIYRVLKPGGIVVIKEHDCDTLSTQFLIDIEHMIHEVVEPEVSNTKILNSYAAFYKSFNELNTIIKNIGFVFVSDNYNFNPKYNPTRYYFATYRKK